MTGRELIMLILSNKLEDVKLFDTFEKEDIIAKLGGIPAIDYAVKHNQGFETVRTLFVLGKLKGIMVDDELFIFG